MKCYKCNSVLTDSDYCIKCGADVSVYKIVVKASNSYYNLGLAKAQVRDLSGAVISLKTSIKINKNNIKARNLLGLIYYEMGEVADALSEWVISLNIRQDRNVAAVYIKKVKSNPNKLEAMNQAIKKYNYALEQSKSDGEDVALIQLKKVTATYPNYVKANLLLALIYIHSNDKDKAKKALNRVLKVDRNNTLALRYMDEIDETGIASVKSDDGFVAKTKKSRIKDRELTGNDVIIPPTSYKEPSSGVLYVINVLAGVIIGALLIWFVVVPAKIQNVTSNNNDTIKEYSSQLSANSIKIKDLQTSVDDLTAKLKKAQEELKTYEGDNGQASMYDALIEAANAYVTNELESATTLMAGIDVTKLPTDTAKSLYSTMLENCSGGATQFYNSGVKAYNEKDYATAVNYLKAAIVYDNTKAEIPYYIAMSYLGLQDNNNAKTYFQVLVDKFPNTTFAAEAQKQLGNTTE